MSLVSYDEEYSRGWSFGSTYRKYHDRKIGARQKPFVDKNLIIPYVRLHSRDIGTSIVLVNGAPYNIYDVPNFQPVVHCYGSLSSMPPLLQTAYNAAYNQLRAKVLGSYAEVGTSLAEGRSTLASLRNRTALGRNNALYQLVNGVVSLADATLALKSGDLGRFAKALGYKRSIGNTVRTKSRDAASLWLEYWLFLAPTVQTVNDAMSVLEQEYGNSNSVRLYGMSTRSTRTTIKSPVFAHDVGTSRYDYTYQAACGATFVIINHNAALRARLGLDNPAVVAWELVPLSFVINWVFDLKTWLQAFTPFEGYRVENEWSTLRVRAEWVQNYVHAPTKTAWNRHGTAFALQRRAGLPRPVPVFDLPQRLSVTRALTAASLLVSLFVKP